MNTARPRLCVVTPVHWKAFMGGAQYQVKCLLDHLHSLDRYEIDYVARRAPDDPELDGYRLHRIGRGNRKPRFGYASDAPELYRLLRHLRPDVIYQRVGCAYTGIAALYARRHGARLVWHASSDADLARDKRIGRKNVVRQYREDSLLSYGIRNAHHVVVQTQHQARMLSANYSRDPRAIIGNFHPLPTDVRTGRADGRILWIANLKRLKQPEVFVRLANNLKDVPTAQFVVIGASAAGDGDTRWTQALLEQMGNTSNLRYLGELSQDEVNAQLVGATALVNTSLYEGFPNTFIQAWLRGVPVVSLAVNPDGVLDRASVGMHAESEDELAQATRRLLEDHGFRDRLARNARGYAQEFHSMKNAQRLADVLEEALDSVRHHLQQPSPCGPPARGHRAEEVRTE